jgi:hypothetical protein
MVEKIKQTKKKKEEGQLNSLKAVRGRRFEKGYIVEKPVEGEKGEKKE